MTWCMCTKYGNRENEDGYLNCLHIWREGEEGMSICHSGGGMKRHYLCIQGAGSKALRGI